jgi:hypothetical protein
MNLLKNFEDDIKRESLRFMVQKQMFCKYSRAVLDVNNAIMIDAFDKHDKLVSTHVIDGRFESKLDEIKSAARNKGLKLEIYINKK